MLIEAFKSLSIEFPQSHGNQLESLTKLTGYDLSFLIPSNSTELDLFTLGLQSHHRVGYYPSQGFGLPCPAAFTQR